MKKQKSIQEVPWISQFRTYSVKEIAIMYYPLLTPNSATRNLSRLIHGDVEFATKLKEYGYHKGIRTLTPAMVCIIASYLGTPNDFQEIL